MINELPLDPCRGTTYRLKIAPTDAREVYRVAEVGGVCSLAELHELIRDAFALGGGGRYTFYLSGRLGDEHSAFGPLAGQWEASARPVGRLALLPGKRFVYVYEGHEEVAHEIDVLEVLRQPRGEAQCRITESVGTAPPLGRGPLVPEDLAEDLARCVLAEEGTEDLDLHSITASRLFDLLEDDEQRLWKAEDELGLDILDWLVSLPAALSNAQRHDDALEIAGRAARLTNPATFHGESARILAEAGRKDDARRQIARNIDAFGKDPWIFYSAGITLEILGDVAGAKHRFLEAIEMPSLDVGSELAAVAHLIDLCEKAGQDEEAARWNARLERLEARLDGESQAIAKTGRNAPCPCGSGKKYKRCCGGGATATAEVDWVSIYKALLDTFGADFDSDDFRPEFRRIVAGFAGEEFGALTFGETLPLLAGREAEHFLLAELICRPAGEDGTSLGERRLRRRGYMLDRHVRELLEGLLAAEVEICCSLGDAPNGGSRVRRHLPAGSGRGEAIEVRWLPPGFPMAQSVIFATRLVPVSSGETLAVAPLSLSPDALDDPRHRSHEQLFRNG